MLLIQTERNGKSYDKHVLLRHMAQASVHSVYLFICDLFNDVSNSDYVTSIGKMINELKSRSKVGRGQFELLFRHLSGYLR
jgi:hypothetical protein